MHEASAIIMAAGQGQRMRSTLPKSLVPVAGRPIIRHLLDATEGAGVTQIAVVVGHKAADMQAYLGDAYTTPMQVIRSGTANAVEVAQASVEGARDVFVFVGDSPLIRTESIVRLYAEHHAHGAACSFLTARFGTHFPYARVLRDPGGSVSAVIEERDCTQEQFAVREYLTSHFLFDAQALWSVLGQVQAHPVTGERYLTDVIGLLLGAGRKVQAVAIDDWRELVGLNTPEEVKWAEGVLCED